jgi:hypothetical protein
MRLAKSAAEVDAAETLIRADVEQIDRSLTPMRQSTRLFQAKLGLDLSFMV